MRTREPDSDLAALPGAVRAAAHIFANGEVAWPNEQAEAAINALAASGKLIVGLDARTLSSDGGVMEIPVSAWSQRPGEGPDDAVERARTEALKALRLAQAEGTLVLVSW
jgi:hypothetical protein